MTYAPIVAWVKLLVFIYNFGAGEEIRTLDPNLGKVHPKSKLLSLQDIWRT